MKQQNDISKTVILEPNGNDEKFKEIQKGNVPTGLKNNFHRGCLTKHQVPRSWCQTFLNCCLTFTFLYEFCKNIKLKCT